MNQKKDMKSNNSKGQSSQQKNNSKGGQSSAETQAANLGG